MKTGMMSERRNKLNCYPKIFIHPSSEKKIFEKILGTKNLKGKNILLKPKNIVEKIFEKFFTSRYYKKKFKALLQINEKVTILSLEDNNIHLLKAQKFVEKAKASGMSESDAKKQAQKIIGATWDVGHTNMLRKYGYDKADLIKQAEIIAPYVKKVHLSDNFGLEHTELPMGMGNVPIKEIMEKLGKGLS